MAIGELTTTIGFCAALSYDSCMKFFKAAIVIFLLAPEFSDILTVKNITH